MKHLILTASAGLLLLGLSVHALAEEQASAIRLDPASSDRVFEGIGGVSAGASSRLLFDYPEPQRSEILDHLFKPQYGASLHHLKVEIGGDVNSTDGVEPSHMHTRTDENHARGYEWWLMKEAKKRNPDILLDCLAWGAPAWIGNGNYYSQDMADYVVKFIKGARQAHGLDINFTGIWNEKPYDIAWIKRLRQTLDAAGLQQVGIIASDQCADVWKIADDINHDPKLKAAVFAIGVHYPRCRSTPAALQTGMRLWSSEDGPWSGVWNAAATGSQTPLQVTYNRNYIIGKMTKTEIWSPITSYYDNLPLPGSGLMRANTPWSGYYELQPALWVTAHTTQFAQPGWKYLDSACRLLPGSGSVVALQAPNARDYSIIIETTDAKMPRSLTFQLEGGLSCGSVHVWRTGATEQFQRLADITPRDGAFTVTVDPQSVYSLTNTSGQRKGGAIPPSSAPFPFEYHEDFGSYAPGATPKYWSDIAGVFEVTARSDGKGNALRQIIDRKGIEWRPNPLPESICGDVNWEDYTISTDALIEKSGFVSLLGRIAAEDANYRLNVTDRGDWELLAGKTKLRGGKVPFSADAWHNLKLAFRDDEILITIDGAQVARVEDRSVDHGNAGIGCGWHPAQFASITIHSQPPPEDLARGKRATASSQWGEEYNAGRANDGDFTTRWNAADGKSTGEWLEIDLGKPTTFDRTVIRQFDNRITRYTIQYWDGTAWRSAFSGGPMSAAQRDRFPAVTGSKVRLLVLETRGGQTPSVFSMDCFRAGPTR